MLKHFSQRSAGAFCFHIFVACLFGVTAATGAQTPNYSLWGGVVHSSKGQPRVRAQVRDEAGKFLAANAEAQILTDGSYYIGGGTWDHQAGEASAFVVDHEGKQTIAKVSGAKAVAKKHLFTYIGSGSSYQSIKPSTPYHGRVAEVIVFDRVLSTGEHRQVVDYLLARHFKGDAQGLPVSGAVLWLDGEGIEEDGGTVKQWKDRSGFDNHAKLRGSAAKAIDSSTPGGTSAVEFDGSGYYEIGANPQAFDGDKRTWFFVFSADELNNGRVINSAYADTIPGVEQADADYRLTRMPYNNDGLIVDLGVGLWANPLPMDMDGDGELEMLIASMGKPDRGIYHFRPATDNSPMAVYQPGEKFASAMHNLRACRTSDGTWVVLSPGKIYRDVASHGLTKWETIDYQAEFYTGRANHWMLFDWDGDGVDDLVIGADDWREYGWDDAYDKEGNWTNGPLRGHVWWVKNNGTNDQPKYGSAEQVMAGSEVMETYGNPCPSIADFDGDGLPDIVCGEFLDKLTFYRNIGTRQSPKYAQGRFIEVDGRVVKMELEMIVPVAIDWDGDGHTDLMVGQEDGRVCLMRHTGSVQDGMPVFEAPKFFKQQADTVKIGALCTPSSIDWDGDGDVDLIVGDTAGFVSFLENLGGDPIRWAAPVRLKAGGEVLRVMAGDNGSIQGPAEAKWGYTVAETADWDGDGLSDLLVNNILGRIYWYKNIGTTTEPKLDKARPVLMQRQDPVHNPDWNWWTPEGDEFVTQWRTSIQAIDLTGDGVLDLVALDKDGYLSLFERKKFDGQWKLAPPRHIFRVASGMPSALNHHNLEMSFDEDGNGVNDLEEYDEDGMMRFYHRVHGTKLRKPNKRGVPAVNLDANDELSDRLRLTAGWAGRAGRRKYVLADWDLDGKIDLLVNSVSVNFLKNVADEPGEFVFKDMGPIDSTILAGHTTCPEMMDVNRDGVMDIIVGAEDGYIYQMLNPHGRDK